MRTALLAIGVLLVATACGPHAADAEPAGAAADAAPTSSASGPCDQHHREEALGRALKAARARVGRAAMGPPIAEFEQVYLTPQLPGKPPPPLSTGWMVSYALAGGTLNAGAAVAPPASAPEEVPALPGQAPPSDPTAPPGGVAGPAGTPPRGVPPPPAGAGAASGAPTLPANRLTPADMIAEFVHVDGSVTDL